MRTDPEILVVGGGPAGSTAAMLLARRGREVLLIDRARFPRPKPCGECVDPGAVAVLSRLGLLDDVIPSAPARLDGWRLRVEDADVSASFGGATHGMGISRTVLDAGLLAAARREGVEVCEGVQVVGAVAADAPGARPSVTLHEVGDAGAAYSLRPRVIVGADGLRSAVVRSLDLIARRPRLRKVSLTAHVKGSAGPVGHGLLDVSDGLTLGVAPIGGGIWNATVVSVAPPEDAFGSEPAAFLLDVLRARLPGGDWDIVEGPWASGPFDWPVRRAWAPGAILVGDAAGYFDPFTGQGIYRALRSAELAADAVCASLDRGDWTPLAAYDRAWNREVRWSRRVQHGVEAVLSRPRLRGRVLRRLEASGGLARVIRVTGDAAPPSTLLNPGVWLGGARRG